MRRSRSGSKPRRIDLDRVGREIVGEARCGRLETFRHAESERELLVVPRRSHRDRDGLAADPDLERLLDRDEIAVGLAARGAVSASTRRVE